MALAIFILMAAALALAAYLILSSPSQAPAVSAWEARAAALEERALRDVAAARHMRQEWARPVPAASRRMREAIITGRDPRGLGDGCGRDDRACTGRFRRAAPTRSSAR